MPSKIIPAIGYTELRAFLAKRHKSLEKRREARYQTNDAVEVEILQAGFPRQTGSVVDISRSGLCLFSAAAIGKGAQVKIKLEKQVVIFGEVQYCRPGRSGFQSGIVIQDVFYPAPKASKSKEKDGSPIRRRASS